MNGLTIMASIVVLSSYTIAESSTLSWYNQSQEVTTSTQPSISHSIEIPTTSLTSFQSQHFSTSSPLPQTQSAIFTSSLSNQSDDPSLATPSIPYPTQIKESSSLTRSVHVSSEVQLTSMLKSQYVMESSSIAVSSSTEPFIETTSVYASSHPVMASSSFAGNVTVTPSLNSTVTVQSVPVTMTSQPFTSSSAVNASSSMNMSTPMMSSSAVPTAPPTPTPGTVQFSYKDKDNNSCVTINGTVMFDVTYKTKENESLTATIQLTNENATVSGKCPSAKLDNSTSMISVKWAKFYEMSLEFKFNAEGAWHLSKATFQAQALNNTAKFTNATEGNYSASMLFNQSTDGNYGASSNHSYLCKPSEKLSLGKNVVVHFENIQLQPFDLMKGDKFSNADVCGAGNDDSKPNSLVPIIVGCALAGLIVIVLIAYLIGRRKSSRGYQQV